jgi:hypothetical protein
VQPQTGAIALFLVLFVGGLLTAGYMIRLALKAARGSIKA